MKNKKPENMKTYKAIVSVTFDAPSRELARKRAQEVFPGENVSIRLQEQVLGWLTLSDAAPNA